jgi:bifunctional enzyme CysN/CysC
VTVWLTGLPAAGKSTIATATCERLGHLGYLAILLDGDDLRRGLNSDLAFDRQSRSESVRRTAHVAAILSGDGILTVVALVSPYASDRAVARAIHVERGLPFIEVHVNTRLTICERRDPKGLYRAARSGMLRGLTGVDDPYEPPVAPDLRVPGHGGDPADVAETLAAAVIARVRR